MTSIKKLPLDEIILDERCQARADVDHDAVQEYRSAYEAGTELPPIRVFLVSGKAYLVDGFHRLPAALNAGKRWLRCEIVGEGTIDQAIWHASAVNQSHGVRRTNADKRRAVRIALQTEIGMEQSSRVIAEHVGVSHVFVERVRDEIEAEQRSARQVETDTTSEARKRIGRDGKSYTAKPPRQVETVTTSEAKEPISSEADPIEEASSTKGQEADFLPAYGAELVTVAKALAEVRRALRGRGLPLALEQRLAEAIQNAEGIARYAVPEACPRCEGEGCEKCRGAGWMPRAEAEQLRATAKRLGREVTA